MNPAPHPLHEFLRRRGPTIKQAAKDFADEVTRAGAPVKPGTIIAFAEGKRRPRPPLSEVIARLSDIDELRLLKWNRPAAIPAEAA